MSTGCRDKLQAGSYLWRMSKKHTWPFQNLALRNLSRERWSDVPGFDGLFEVSTHGRIKSLRRWRAAGNAGYYTTEKIRRQGLRVRDNRKVGDQTYCLNIGLKSPGRSVTHSTARYVYYVFVAPFDLNDPLQVISYKDGDGRNLHFSNLQLTDRSRLLIKARQMDRAQTPFDLQRVSVHQLTLGGKLVARFPSITDASVATGCSLSAIASCLRGRLYQAYGYRWASPARKAKPLPAPPRPVFNQTLWEKLGRPRTSRKIPIAALNLSDQDMPDERWRPIEGTGQTYWVSDHGRVKGTPRLKQGKFHVWTKGMVKRLIDDAKPGRKPSCLLCSFSVGGRKYQQSVTRLVYHHFVQPINLKDRTIHIRQKNGKCYDLYYRNLRLEKIRSIPKK
jgi:hypothetical protein